MSRLAIVEWPAEILKSKSSPVEDFDSSLVQLVKDMHETMDHARGIGLAANQVGVAKRLLTIFIPYSKEHEEEEKKEWWHDTRFTFINPEIIKRLGKIRWQEGCLSFPEIYDFVDRAAEVWVRAKDESGKEFEVHATGLLAVCLQHEIDHIDGIVFIDRMSRLKSSMIRKKMVRRGNPASLVEEEK